MSPAPRWSALDRACRHDAAARVPFTIAGHTVGAVARAHLAALRGRHDTLHVGDDHVALDAAPAARDGVLEALNRALRADGLIHAWRDEPYRIVDPRTLEPLATIERASSRFWGTLTFGAHCNGYVAGAGGRPAQLWIAQRAFDKATDPGAYDNLVGGGVPAGQSALQTLWREGWEEAGLPAAVMQRAVPGRIVRLWRDIPEGLQHEWIHVFDLALGDGEQPVNQDGEVHAFTRLPVARALDIAAGDTMTVDAALVTLDLALRHGLLDAAERTAIAPRFAALCVAAPEG